MTRTRRLRRPTVALALRVNIAAVEARTARIADLGVRSPVLRLLMRSARVRRLAAWWAARPLRARRHWRVVTSG